MSRENEYLEDKILELEEDLNHFIDMGDENKVNSILFKLNHLNKYKTQHHDENEREFDPEHLFDDINYIKLHKNYIKDKYELL